MSDDDYPPEWLDGAPPPRDYEPPRHAGLDTRVRETLLHAVRGDNTEYLTTLRHLMMDSHAEMPELLISFGRVFAEMAIGCQGQELTERRLEGEIEYGRELALEEES